MNALTYPADLVPQLDQRLLDALDAPSGWADDPGPLGLDAPRRTLFARAFHHTNGAALRVSQDEHKATSWQAFLAQATVSVRDGQGMVVVQEGWVPFGCIGFTDLETIAVDRLFRWFHRHLGTQAQAQQRWGRHALVQVLHTEVPEAHGDWIARVPGFLVGLVGDAVEAFVQQVHLDEMPEPELLSQIGRLCALLLPSSVRRLHLMTPGMQGALTALGAQNDLMLRLDQTDGRLSALASRLGVRVALGDTGHERMRILQEAQRVMAEPPTSPA